LPQYPIDPIPWDAIDVWLQRNQQAHTDFTGALGQNSSDIMHVDLRDKQQLPGWINLVYMELSSACSALKIGP
jgi:hypothetical protein